MKQKIIDYIEDLEWREQEYYKLIRKIDNAIEYIKNILKWARLQKDWETEKILLNLLILLGGNENE